MTTGKQAPRERLKRDVPVGTLVRGVMANEARKKGVVVAQVLSMWDAVCPMLAKWSYPDKLQGKTLTVVAANDAVKQELMYLVPQLIYGVNQLLGYTGVAHVTVITRSFTKPDKPLCAVMPPPDAATLAKARAACKSVQDDVLRTALEKLGATLFTIKKE